MESTIRYVGLDVHKGTASLWLAGGGGAVLPQEVVCPSWERARR
jgi:hypothetical protein